MRLGSEIDDSMIEERMKQQRADQCVSVVFSVSICLCAPVYLLGIVVLHFVFSIVWYNWTLQEHPADSR